MNSANRDLLARIMGVDPVHAQTMRTNPTSFSVTSLPFYRRFKLVRATVRLRHKPLEFRYADDGVELFVFGGTPDHVMRVNASDGLHLGAKDVSAYLRFFFENTGGGKLRLVEKEGDVSWLPQTDHEPRLRSAREQASTLIETMKVSPVDDHRFVVMAVGLWQGTLIRLAIEVTDVGEVLVKSQAPLMESVPVPAAGP